MRNYTGAPDQICGECRKTYDECAVVRCANCKLGPVICRIIPGVLDNGYHVQKRSVLHTSACNVCRPGLKRSTIIEIDQWEKFVRKGKPQIIVP
jgi:hypothetical protein